MQDKKIEIYGDGLQTRDFTFVSDAVEGNLLAMKHPLGGEVFNIGGGSRVTVNDVLATLEKITMKVPRVVYQDVQKGDVKHTLAETIQVRNTLGYSPQVDLKTGLAKQWEWFQTL